jgi:hypothetical protein
MPTFQFTLAHDVSAYGTVEIVATDLAAAVEQVRSDLETTRQDIWSDVSDIEWGTSFRFRIVDAYQLGDDGMSDAPVVRGIRLSEHDESTPLTSEQVLVSLTAARLTQE